MSERFMLSILSLWVLGAHLSVTASGDSLSPSTICVEAVTGHVLQEENADEVRPPASMIKMALMLMVAKEVEENRVSLTDTIVCTENAQRMGGTQVYLEVGEEWPLEKLVEAVAVASANDAAMAIAEGIWGSKEAYLKAMNLFVQGLGMKNSTFTSVHGLPPEPGEDPDKTTARDMAMLGRACVANAMVMGWVGIKELQFKPDQAVKQSTNKLLWQMEGCDGLKTGYIRAAGFCITATANRDGKRVVAVVMGMEDKYERFRLAEQIMDEGLNTLERVTLLAQFGESVAKVAVGHCRIREVGLAAGVPFEVTVPSGHKSDVELRVDAPQKVMAPLAKGAEVGTLQAWFGNEMIGEIALVTPYDLPSASWKWRLEHGAVALEGGE